MYICPNIYKEMLLLGVIFFSLQINAGEITTRTITGTWHEKSPSGTEVTTFLSDGTWKADVTYLDLLTNMKKTSSVSGTWKIVDSKLVKKITWTKEEKLKGKIVIYSIVSMSKNEIKFKETSGRTGTMKRLKGR